MKRKEVATPSVDPAVPAEKKRLRVRAPDFIKSIIEETRALPAISSLEELRPEHLEPLTGGVEAVTYLVKSPKLQVIIKLMYYGAAAEAEAIETWRAKGARVPYVVAVGTVPATKQSRQPVKYLIEQALLDANNRVVETCASYLTHTPRKARSVGRLMGEQLTKMHATVAKRPFGWFGDAYDSRKQFDSWNTFLLGFFEEQVDYLRQKMKIDEDQIDGVRRLIGKTRFVTRGRYLHGDFSIRNAAMKAHDPMKVSLFDPNPLIGDPYWDIAALFNNHEFQKRRLKHDDSQRDLYVRDQQLVIGFKQGYARKLRDRPLQAAQLIQAILQAQHKETLLADGAGDRLDVRVRQEFIRELIDTLSKKGNRS